MDSSAERGNVTHQEDLGGGGLVWMESASVPRASSNSLKYGSGPPASHKATLCSKESSCLKVPRFPSTPDSVARDRC